MLICSYFVGNLPGNINVGKIHIGVQPYDHYTGYFNNHTVFDGGMRLFVYNGMKLFDLRDGDYGYEIDPHHPIGKTATIFISTL